MEQSSPRTPDPYLASTAFSIDEWQPDGADQESAAFGSEYRISELDLETERAREA